ncbi:MAG: hypothetical protein WAL35_02210, partial [Acidimicrobiales bacterium]
YSPALIAVVLVGFGTAGTAFGATVMGTAAMVDGDQGLVGGVINTTRQMGAAIGAAVLLAIADDGRGVGGVATVGGDRHAMVAGAVAAVLATLVAWRSGRTAIQPRNSLVQIAISRGNHATDRAWDASICE